jgi:hypothetical protein
MVRLLQNQREFFPRILFETYYTIPNLVIRLNNSAIDRSPFDPISGISQLDSDLASLDRRLILPFLISIELLHVRNIMLCGSNPPTHPDFEFILSRFFGHVEHVSVCLFPGQTRGWESLLSRYAQELIFFLGPFSGNDREFLESLFEEMTNDIASLREQKKVPHIRGILYLSAGSFMQLENAIGAVQQAGFDFLEFYPPNLFLPSAGERVYAPLESSLVPGVQDVSFQDVEFWDLMEKRNFATALFDLNQCWRQLDRALNFFKAVQGSGEFSPPHCRASRLSLYIESSGMVRSCPYQKVVGDMNRKPLMEIDRGEPMREFRGQLHLAHNKICPVCPGVYPHLLWRVR